MRDGRLPFPPSPLPQTKRQDSRETQRDLDYSSSSFQSYGVSTDHKETLSLSAQEDIIKEQHFSFPPTLSRSSSSSSSTSTSSVSSLSHRNRPHPLVLKKIVSWSSEDSSSTDSESHPDPLTAVPPRRAPTYSGYLESASLPHPSRTENAQGGGMSAAPWVADQRARSPLAEGGPSAESRSPRSTSFGTLRPPTSPTSAPPRPQVTHRNIPAPTQTPPPQIISAPAPVRSPSYSQTLASPCFVHSHLDNSLSDFIKKDAAAAEMRKRKSSSAAKKKPTTLPNGTLEEVDGDDDSTASEGAVEEEDEEDEDEGPSLTRQLAETAVSVREMSKQLGRARVISHIQSVMIITKARDNHLIKLTRELALWLMQTPRNGRDRGLVVYVDNQLRKSKRFDADGMQRDFPDLFRPLPRRYSRTSSSSSLAGTMFESAAAKKMTPLSQLNTQLTEAIKKNGGDHFKRNDEEGQLRYWTNEMCTKSPHLFDFVITLGGDGTVLYASWLFQHVVPPVIPFALGSLGFLTNFDFSSYAYTLNAAIDNGIRVNLRMRFTCTVYRAIEGEENKKRRAIRSGKTGGIFMNNLTTDGWEAIENGGAAHRETGKKDKEIKCFSTRPVESFEVLNDLVVDRGPSPYVSLLELFGDEHHMTTVQADGLTVSTPTGSTAYSLSAGGSLVHPEIPALLITPICPHTLSFRPMLLPDSMELRICVPYNSRSTAWASFDGRGRVELRQGDHIKVTASQYPFPTVCADKQSTDWFQSIQRTLKWNERQRQKSFVILEEGRKKSTSRKASMREDTVLPAGHSGDATAKAKEDFGDEEDDDEEEEEEGSSDGSNSDDGTFDIDDLSSENPTNASSPASHPTDPNVGHIPDLSRNSSISSQSYAAFSAHDREMSSASSVDLQENTADRFHDKAPKPPKLSSRHSHNEHSTVRDQSPISPGSGHHRMSESTVRRRARGEEGDRDHIRESLDVKRTVGGARRRMKSASRERDSKAKVKAQQTAESSTDGQYSEGRTFAVFGADDESSVDDSDGTHDLA